MIRRTWLGNTEYSLDDEHNASSSGIVRITRLNSKGGESVVKILKDSVREE